MDNLPLTKRHIELFGESPSPAELVSPPASPEKEFKRRKVLREEFIENLSQICYSKDMDALGNFINECKACKLPQVFAAIVQSKLMDSRTAIKFIDKNRDGDNKSLLWIIRIIIENPILMIHFVGMLEEAKKRKILTLDDVDKMMRACTVSQLPSLLHVVLSMTQGMSKKNRAKLQHHEKFLRLMEITVEAGKLIEKLLR